LLVLRNQAQALQTSITHSQYRRYIIVRMVTGSKAAHYATLSDVQIPATTINPYGDGTARSIANQLGAPWLPDAVEMEALTNSSEGQPPLLGL
jgi:hypothetical protein